MPSMVPISAPSASTARTRQAQTRRPSTVTLQAPQSPVPQPSLVPVRPSVLRSTSSRLLPGSARNSTGSWLMLVVMWVLDMGSIPPRAGRGVGDGALQQHAGDLGAVDDGAALVVDGIAGGAAGGGGGFQRRVVQPAADQRLRRILDQQHGRRHGAE